MMEKKDITGLSIDDKVNKIEVSNIKNYHNLFDALLDILGFHNIKFGMFMQCKQDKISFVVNDIDVAQIKKELELLKKDYLFEYVIRNDFDCITLVGLGFVSSPQLSIDIYRELNNKEIYIDQSIISNLSLSMLIDRDKSKETVSILSESFNI
ncbi:MAG: hypothetical protein RR543_00215 [Erysipelotrichales bacterium]